MILRVIMSCMSSTGLPSKGMTPPTPALLTSKVMLASVRSRSSTRSRSDGSFRSAATTSTARPVSLLRWVASEFSLARLRATRIRS
ncbi:hypothetical protein D3C73_1298250 [compost metagenome]